MQIIGGKLRPVTVRKSPLVFMLETIGSEKNAGNPNPNSTSSCLRLLAIKRMPVAQTQTQTRMHSSSMRNVRCSGRCGEGVSAWGAVCPGVVCLGGDVCPGGCLPRGCLPMGCLSIGEGVCPGGCLSRGVVAQCMLGYTHTPMDIILDTRL